MTVTDKYNQSILLLALRRRKTECLKVIFSFDEATLTELVKIANSRGRFPIHFAVSMMTSEPLERIVGLGEDVQRRDDKLETPLHYAVRAGSLKNVEFLLKTKDVDINSVSADGTSVLMAAILSYESYVRGTRVRAKKPIPRPFITIIIRLLAANANIHLETQFPIFRVSRGAMSQAPLEIAVKGGLTDVAQILVSLGARLPLGLNVQASKYLKANEELFDFVMTSLSQPLSLKNLSRIKIRNELGVSMRFSTSQLPLPRSLQEFLELSDYRELCLADVNTELQQDTSYSLNATYSDESDVDI